MTSIGDHVVQLIVSVFLIVGVYQFYFWCQKNPLSMKTRFLRSPLDDQIPYRPGWVWIYSFLYYPVILLINLTTVSSRQFLYVVISYVVLLLMQMSLFLFFPVSTPTEWRAYNHRRTLSERLMAVVHRFDAPTNSFPSMHTSVAMLTALHLQSSLGVMIFVFPLLIAASCLYTKQHYVIDLPAGAFVGWVAFIVFRFLF